MPAVFVFRTSLSASAEMPAPKDENGDDVPVVRVSMTELTTILAALADVRTGNMSSPYDGKLVNSANNALSDVTLKYVTSFVCNGSRPIGPIWEDPGMQEFYLHPIDGDGAVCIGRRTLDGDDSWYTLSILAERQ